MKRVRKEDLNNEFVKLLYWLHNLLKSAPDNFGKGEEMESFRDLLGKFRELNRTLIDLNKYYSLGRGKPAGCGKRS